MKLKANITSNLIGASNIKLFKFLLLELSMLSMIFIMSESVQAQGCLAILKINDPAPVCYPATVDLTTVEVTAGSTQGLKFSYYLDSKLTDKITDPSKVPAGTYYIKGVMTDPRTALVAGSVNVIIWGKPKLIVVSKILINIKERTDLTSLLVTTGSDEGLTYSYWNDSKATIPLLSPELSAKGNYYIKGTSLNGCFDIQPIIVDEK